MHEISLNFKCVLKYYLAGGGDFVALMAFVYRLHTQDQDHRRGLQCLQQRAGQNQDPGEELHRPHRQPSIQAVV